MANTRSAPAAAELHLHWQPTLLDAAAPAGSRATAPNLDPTNFDPTNFDPTNFDPTFANARRIALDASAWVEHTGAWVRGADPLFERVVEVAPWEHRTVRMYDRMVDEPRLTAWYGRALDDPSVPPLFHDMIVALRARYDRPFDGVGAALYRDGRDSVAWHSDRVAPTLVEPVVAILSLGSARTLRMRPKSAGATRPFRLLPGDLFVMGGAVQATWQHSVPKVAGAGARVSVQFRHST